MFSLGAMANRMIGLNPTGFMPNPGTVSTFPADF